MSSLKRPTATKKIKARTRQKAKQPKTISRRPTKQAQKYQEMNYSELPFWCQPSANGTLNLSLILGSAVRYVASLSSLFNWVGIYKLKGKILELGPFLGAETEHHRIPVGVGICGMAVQEGKDQNIADVSTHANYLACSIETRSELVILIRENGLPAGRILGQLDIDSHTPKAFGPDEVQQVRLIAEGLGRLWHV